ncbi:DUF5641 domain-containing protein [Nephila pilipes]|uniref:DUF5641 domain-containing protein n=1 Tax=Nephila pilipes TaxID=299642 RepID=A0A8X6NFE1_NEPPI|nr:DUF5641 domain-containing protein [Nephila pilipes]
MHCAAGDETEPKSHKVFAIEVSSLNRVFSCGFEAFSEKKICGFIPRIENDEILNELKRKKIVFADFFREETDINLLIGADVLGKLLTGNTVVLECGLTAVETKLGWTVFGKGSCRIDNILTSLSMHSMSLPAIKLWELEVLGIASENEKEKDDFNLKDFNDKIKILPNGRYEGVCNVAVADNFVEKAQLIMSKGCFNLRGWESNVGCKHTSRNSGDTSVLGIIWNLDEDTLKCKIDFEILSCGTKINKRLILSTVQKLYDPIGVLTPTSLLPKLIIQDLWKSHFSWDEELPPSIVNRFSKWLNEIMLLIENRISNTDDMEELNSRSLNKRKKYRSKLLKDFRQRFRKEYLGQLVQKYNEKQLRNPQICEIVLVGDDNKIRLFWPLAKIIELIPGRDGKIRTVKLKTQHGTVLRPIQCIYPLEIYSKESIDGELGGVEFNSNNVTDNENNVTSADAVIVRKFT